MRSGYISGMKDPEKIKAQIARHISIDTVRGCWLWVGDSVKGGYGRTVVDGRKWLAHRAAYTAYVGSIPEGLTIDHLCVRPACCNPAHLEPVTMKENTMRGNSFSRINAEKTHCALGHPFEGENLYRYKDGRRECRTCMIVRQRAYYSANRERIIKRERARYEARKAK